MKVWRNGKLTDPGGAVSALDRGVTLGDGLFETLAILDGVPLRLGRHTARLRAGAEALRIPVAFDDGVIQRALADTAFVNGVTEGAARVTLLRGPGRRGVAPPIDMSPTLLIAVTPGTVGGLEAVSARISTETRRNDQSPVSRVKSTNYLDAVVALMEANEAGADEAILLNTRGTVAEATSANVFAVTDGALVTPPLSDGALPGVLRARVMETETVVEAALTPADLAAADEVILTSSIRIRAVTTLDGNPIGEAAPGPLARRLARLPREDA